MRGAISPLPQYAFVEWCSIKKIIKLLVNFPSHLLWSLDHFLVFVFHVVTNGVSCLDYGVSYLVNLHQNTQRAKFRFTTLLVLKWLPCNIRRNVSNSMSTQILFLGDRKTQFDSQHREYKLFSPPRLDRLWRPSSLLSNGYRRVNSFRPEAGEVWSWPLNFIYFQG
jgi:hypothetical protein